MRKGLTVLAASAALSLALAAGPANAATVLDVAWNTGCGKASCFDDKGVFTQTFSSGAFQGPVTVGQLLMDRGVLGALDGETFRISFQLNGEELGAWGKFNVSGLAGDELSFGGETFTWNPEDGDLVLVVEIVAPPKPGAGGGFFAALGAPAPEQPDERGDEEQPPVEGGRQVAVVPEPGAWALMITGFGFAGAMMRRRRGAVLPLQP